MIYEDASRRTVARSGVTRRTEMMADAFAAYELAHVCSASMQSKRITELVEAAVDAGDCGFDSPGYHGTPNQRAAAWGAALASEAQPKSRVISPEMMPDLFDAELPALVAPDAA